MSKKRSVKSAKTFCFEEAIEQLGTIVLELEEGKIGLEESLERYEEGVKLLRQCSDVLNGVQRRIELLSGVDGDGNPIAEPLDDTKLSLDEKATRRSQRRSTSEESLARESDDDVDGSARLF